MDLHAGARTSLRQRNNRKAFVIIGVAVILFGGIFAGVGAAFWASAPQTDRTAQGVLVSVEQGEDTCTATARFEVDGETYTARTSVGASDMCDRFPGDRLEVHYASDNPTENEFGMRQRTFGLIFLGVGAPIMLVGLGFLGAGILGWLRSRETRAPGEVSRGATGLSVSAPAPPSDSDGPSDGGVRPGWYPLDDGVHERWHNGMDWSDAVRRIGDQPPQ